MGTWAWDSGSQDGDTFMIKLVRQLPSVWGDSVFPDSESKQGRALVSSPLKLSATCLGLTRLSSSLRQFSGCFTAGDLSFAAKQEEAQTTKPTS